MADGPLLVSDDLREAAARAVAKTQFVAGFSDREIDEHNREVADAVLGVVAPRLIEQGYRRGLGADQAEAVEYARQLDEKAVQQGVEQGIQQARNAVGEIEITEGDQEIGQIYMRKRALAAIDALGKEAGDE